MRASAAAANVISNEQPLPREAAHLALQPDRGRARHQRGHEGQSQGQGRFFQQAASER